ncbi:hypothetical protein K474DRAFT_943641 [Panus rudis PR-1116 ss-1]|nr:hypothetical protein K474DRAFT_943641 [Panus rudis PR-1116 ss-1]
MPLSPQQDSVSLSLSVLQALLNFIRQSARACTAYRTKVSALLARVWRSLLHLLLLRFGRRRPKGELGPKPGGSHETQRLSVIASGFNSSSYVAIEQHGHEEIGHNLTTSHAIICMSEVPKGLSDFTPPPTSSQPHTPPPRARAPPLDRNTNITHDTNDTSSRPPSFVLTQPTPRPTLLSPPYGQSSSQSHLPSAAHLDVRLSNLYANSEPTRSVTHISTRPSSRNTFQDRWLGLGTNPSTRPPSTRPASISSSAGAYSEASAHMMLRDHKKRVNTGIAVPGAQNMNRPRSRASSVGSRRLSSVPSRMGDIAESVQNQSVQSIAVPSSYSGVGEGGGGAEGVATTTATTVATASTEVDVSAGFRQGPYPGVELQRYERKYIM